MTYYSEKECGEIAPGGMGKRARAIEKKNDGIRRRISTVEREALREKGWDREKSRSMRLKINYKGLIPRKFEIQVW